MLVLQICKKFPFPLKDGESIAITHLAKAMTELGAEVTLLAMNTTKHHVDTSNLPKNFNHYESVYFTEIDNRINPVSAFLNLFSSESFHISRYISRSFEKLLIQILQKNEFDIIQLETLYLAPYIPAIRKHSKAQISMRAHNVEFEIWQRITEHTTNPLKKWYLNHLTSKLKKYEIAQLVNYDILVPITDRDAKIFASLGFKGKMQVVPIGIDKNDYVANNSSFDRELSLSFIGSLDWLPNIEGLNFFLHEIWPVLHKKFPKLTFHVAGRNTPESLKSKNLPGVVFEGEVADAVEFLNKHSVMLVPILSGSGMRAKILEGMALGKVVITTTIGLEGNEARHKDHLLVADNTDDFVDCIEYCYKQKDNLAKIGQNAQSFIFEQHHNLELAKRLMNRYKSPSLIAVS